jgi:chemotaxis protein MotB
VRPNVASGLRITAPANDEDQTGWLVTFSDLVLQLFAFVLITSVFGSHPATVAEPAAVPPEAVRPTPSPRVEERAAAPMHVAQTQIAPTRAARTEEDRRETVEEAVRALAPPQVVEPVAAEPPAPTQPASELERAGALLARAVADSGHADAVSVQVSPRDVVLSMNDAIGFPSGRADLGPEAAGILQEVARVVATLPDVRVDVVGHTDDRPIHTPQFPSNLELSLARAARVARELGVIDPRLQTRTFAAGAGAERPMVSNDSPAGRARNRRVDIRLVPRDQVPSVG